MELWQTPLQPQSADLEAAISLFSETFLLPGKMAELSKFLDASLQYVLGRVPATNRSPLLVSVCLNSIIRKEAPIQSMCSMRAQIENPLVGEQLGHGVVHWPAKHTMAAPCSLKGEIVVKGRPGFQLAITHIPQF